MPIPEACNKYRPIAIVQFISKVYESVLHEQINKSLSSNKIISQFQSCYRSGHSCISALINVTEDIRNEADANNINFLTLLDHSKAFDTLHNDTLCMKLSKL